VGETVEHVQTKREIESALSGMGVRPRKRFGQHFLIDGNMMRRLVEVAEISLSDTVLEVGPGTGGLTDLLVRRAKRVIAVEIDRDLFAFLSDRFQNDENVLLIHGDVLTGKHEIRSAVADAIEAITANAGEVKLVANLPYNVATPLVMNLLVDYPQVRRFCFTVQAEVGERISAPPSCKAYGPLSILSQTLCDVRIVGRLGPQYFWPRPAVDSVMMRMDVRASPFDSRDELGDFVNFVRAVFEHRRKTLRSALGYVVEDVVRDGLCQEFDASRRPEELDVQEWHSLFRRMAELRKTQDDLSRQ